MRVSPAAADIPAPEEAPPLLDDRSTVLVTGANGKLGGAIVRELLSTGVATRILAHVSLESEAEFEESNVAKVVADLGTETGVGQVASAALNAGVGSVIFAASGGPAACASVDNAAIGLLTKAMSPELGERGSGDVAMLFDFSTSDAVNAFSPVDDVVMGGRSSSGMQILDGYARFGGNVTTVGGGGFAQARAQVSDGAVSGTRGTVDLSEYGGIQLRVRGDDAARVYKMNVKDEEVPDFAYQAAFTVPPGREWQTIRLPFSSFIPMRRGQPQYADVPGASMYASTLDTSRVRTVGIVLSLVSDGLFKVANVREREGAFALDLSYIGAYIDAPPRFVLVSSAAVTRPFWGADERARKGESLANIPIVQLNPGRIFAHKLAGENALRSARMSYCVVRPIELNDEVPSGRVLALRQGDTVSGRMTREDVARGVVAALRSPAAAYKTFEVGTAVEAAMSNDDVADKAFEKLVADEAEVLYGAKVDDMLAADPPAQAAASAQ